MKVTSNPSYMVKPAKPTWTGRLALSEIEQIGMITHVPTIYFFTKPSHNWNTVLQTLKIALATTLVHFYPLAGCLESIAGSRLELNCNAVGVQFIEAYADVKLFNFDDLRQYPVFDKLIPSVDYRCTPIEETPVLLLQVTRFLCGGWSLGVFMSHVVADGQSGFHFLSEWARVCRGEPLGPPPCLDKKLLGVGDPERITCFNKSVNEHALFSSLPTLLGESSNESERRQEKTVTILRLTNTLVGKLKNKANKNRRTETERNFTRYEVVTAHVWKTACKIRNLEPEQKTSLCICLDVRSRMNPPLPKKYFGNPIIDVITTATSGEIVSATLGYVSTMIRDTIEKVDDDFVNSKIDFLKNQQDLSKFQDLKSIKGDEAPFFYGNPNLAVFSWLNLPMRGLDFGWGEEVFMGPGTRDDQDGDFLILPGDGGGSVAVLLCLQVRHTEDFKKVFYQSVEED